MTALAEFDELSDTRDFADCWDAFTPPPEIKTLPWAVENIVTDLGRPYDQSTYPHMSAPGGPMDAFDDPTVRTISLQWGVRLGKTFFGQVACCKTAGTKPAPMMLVSPQEKLSREQVGRTYEMLRKSPTIRKLLALSERLQKQDLIQFTGCKMYVGWARSASTLADKKIVVGHGTEIDKWEHSEKSTEGDPWDLFMDRFNDDFIIRKVIGEGTPTIKGRSRIERLRLVGWNCSYHVPCPHCKRYQVIEMGDETSRHGIKWDPSPDGRRDPELARRTARYVCRHCHGSISSEARPWMMRRGVWCPEGCTVIDETALAVSEGRQPYEWRGWKSAAWVKGTPARDGEDSSYHLATLCALQIPEWGDFAKKFLRSLSKKGSLRTFVNQWLAQTWEDTERKTTWEQLGAKIISDTPRYCLPDGFVLLTAGCDKQETHYVYAIDAWNARGCSHTVDYGDAQSLEELQELVLNRRFRTADGGSTRVRLALIDSGYRPADVYRFCRRVKRFLPAKGSSTNLGTFVLKKKLGKKTSAPGQVIAFIDTQSTQDWIDKQLHTLRRGDDGSCTVFADGLTEHQDFLEQLLNDAPAATLDSSNNVRERWVRIDEHTPNDRRDARRYAFAAMQLLTRGAPIRSGTPRPRLPAPGETPVHDPTSGASPRRFPVLKLQPRR